MLMEPSEREFYLAVESAKPYIYHRFADIFRGSLSQPEIEEIIEAGREKTLQLWETLYNPFGYFKVTIYRNALSRSIRRIEQRRKEEEYFMCEKAQQMENGRLYRFINELPEEDRRLMKKHIKGYNYKEIGEKLGISPFTVGCRIRGLILDLRRILAEHPERFA